MKSSHIAFSALSAAVLLLALVSAGCTGTGNNNPGTLPTPTATTAVSGDLMNSGMVGTWQATERIAKYDEPIDIIYSFNGDGTGNAYYYLKWNNSATPALPFTWSIANSKLNTFDVVYPTIQQKYPSMSSSDTFRLADDKMSIVDGYNIKYTKSTVDDSLITGKWKSVNKYHYGDNEKYYDVSYTFYENGTGFDAWYLDGNLTQSDPLVWDYLRINDEGNYIYYLDYPQYIVDIHELLFLSPDGKVMEDKYNVTYMRE